MLIGGVKVSRYEEGGRVMLKHLRGSGAIVHTAWPPATCHNEADGKPT